MLIPKILIINSCSKSKSVSHEAQPKCSDLISKERREIQKLKFKEILTPAGQLYTGQQAKSIAKSVQLLKKQHKVDYYIISAGFGLVKESELLPPYECSFSNLRKQDIRRMSQSLEIEKSLQNEIRDSYDLIYLALGKDYITALGNLQFLASRTSLLIHFIKELKEPNKKPFYLIEDSKIINKISKIREKVFTKPLGALITSKGTILENYALEISENKLTVEEFPFKNWIEEKIDKINLLSEIQI